MTSVIPRQASASVMASLCRSSGDCLGTANRKQQTAMRMSMEIPLYWRSIRLGETIGSALGILSDTNVVRSPPRRMMELRLISVIVPVCAELQGNHFFGSRKWAQFEGRDRTTDTAIFRLMLYRKITHLSK